MNYCNMENKTNIAKLLKDCPKGMELNCTMYEDVYFDYVDELNIIHCYIQHETYKTYLTFNQHGTHNSGIKSKCVIFPKGKTTWEGFHRPFKDGDIVAVADTIYIYNGVEELSPYPSHYVYVIADKNGIFAKNTSTKIYGARFATEEEKQKLFDAIKEHGYKWNSETKTLEKVFELKFKVGDKIKKVNGYISGIITNIYDDGSYKVEYQGGGISYVHPIFQDEWELVPNKFDITNLKPFNKVLIRDRNTDEWNCHFFSYYRKNSDRPYVCIGWNSTNEYKQCIPYGENKHLLGATDNCTEFYKIW